MNLIYVFIFLVSICVHCFGEIIQVHIIYRHGDRAPISTYPTDPISPKKWKYGLGQLTGVGINQHFKLGQWLQNRYKDILGNYYNNSIIYVRSTDVDRTLMSAESNLAGLFYNHSRKIIPGLNWRPVPVHTVNQTTDFLLSGQDECRAYQPELSRIWKTTYFQNKILPYKSFISYIANKSGYLNYSMSSFWHVYDVLFCEKTHNFTLPGWVTDEVWRKMKILNIINWEAMYYEDLARMGAGVLLKRISEHLQQANQPIQQVVPRIYMYSGHDTDVGPLAKLLLNKPSPQPPYASTILLELHKDSKNEYSVKFFYKNFTESKIPSVTLPSLHIDGCPDATTACSLKQFLKATSKKTLTKKEYLILCQNTAMDSEYTIYLLKLFFIVTACLLILSILFISIYYNRRSAALLASSNRYSPLHNQKNIN